MRHPVRRVKSAQSLLQALVNPQKKRRIDTSASSASAFLTPTTDATSGYPTTSSSLTLGLHFGDQQIVRLEAEIDKLKLELKESNEKLLLATSAAAKFEGQLLSQKVVEENQKETIKFLKELIEKK